MGVKDFELKVSYLNGKLIEIKNLQESKKDSKKEADYLATKMIDEKSSCKDTSVISTINLIVNYVQTKKPTLEELRNAIGIMIDDYSSRARVLRGTTL